MYFPLKILQPFLVPISSTAKLDQAVLSFREDQQCFWTVEATAVSLYRNALKQIIDSTFLLSTYKLALRAYE